MQDVPDSSVDSQEPGRRRVNGMALGEIQRASNWEHVVEEMGVAEAFDLISLRGRAWNGLKEDVKVAEPLVDLECERQRVSRPIDVGTFIRWPTPSSNMLRMANAACFEGSRGSSN